MRQGSRKFIQKRKSLLEKFGQMGYDCTDRGDKEKRRYEKFDEVTHGLGCGNWTRLRFENCLKKFNKGEAYWFSENRSSVMSRVWWKANKDQTQLIECQERFRDWLTCGSEFKYNRNGRELIGQVDFIDYDEPEMNTFEVVEAWQARALDDYLWDLVIRVNTMPICGIVMADTLRQAYNDMKTMLVGDMGASTYLQILMISDGKQTLVGTSTDKFEEFSKWPSLMGEDGEGEWFTPMLSMLRPDRLCKIISRYMDIVEVEETGEKYIALTDCHYFFMEELTLDFVTKNKEPKDGRCGHLLVIEDEDHEGRCRSAMVNLVGQISIRELGNIETFVNLFDNPYPNDPAVGHRADTLIFVGPDKSVMECRKIVEEFPEAMIIIFGTRKRGGMLDAYPGELIHSYNTQLSNPQA